MTELEKEDIEKVALLNASWDKLKNKTLILSGGTGFLGQFLIEVIKYRNYKFGDNIKVVSLSRRPLNGEENIEYLQCDVTQAVVCGAKADFIIHLASNTHPVQYSSDPVGTITTNVLGCKNLLDLAVKNRARFLLASSVEIYGEGDGREMDENFCGYIDCNTARAGYNEAKRVSESLCQSYRLQYGLDCVIARLSRCFGADRKDDSKAMAQFMKNAVEGRDIVLNSKGLQRFSYCYVADAVGGMIKILLDGADGEAYNVSEDDEGQTLGGYAKVIAGLAGVEVSFKTAVQTGVSKASYAVLNCEKLKSLGWRPLFATTQALKRTYDILKDRG